MVRLDLFALAQSNETALSKQLEARRRTMSDEHAALLDELCGSVKEHGGISVNMKPKKLLVFLHRGRYLSVWELAAELASISGRSADDELRAMQGRYYEQRALFDKSFVDGEQFLYGALNIGGAGAWEYGLFGVFLNDDATRAVRSAFLPDNSLDRYVKPALVLSLNVDALRQEVATPAQRHCLAALKHADDIPSTEASNWATMLCSRERFVEAIFVGTISPDRVTELRIKREEMRRLSDLAFDDMLGVLAPSDRAELDELRAAMDKLHELGLAARIKEV